MAAAADRLGMCTRPGLRITLAMLDLLMGNPVTGTAKFMSALIIAVNLGIGIMAGLSVGSFITGRESDQAVAEEARFAVTPEWFLPMAIIVSVFPGCVLLDAHLTHFPQYIAGSFLALDLSNYASKYIGGGGRSEGRIRWRWHLCSSHGDA